VSPSTDPVAAISQRLDTFIVGVRDSTAELGPEAALLVEAGATALRGGKRLRGRFCIAGYRAVAEAEGGSADLSPEVVAAAASLEIFHAAALVHDDVIDNSDTRRGRPAAHRSLEASHAGSGWVGDASAFGRSGAILLGDLLVAWSDDLREGKRTVLIAFTRERLDPEARRLVDELIGDPKLDDAQIASLQRTIVDAGALDRVEALIADYAVEAERALSGANLGTTALAELRELARAATVRTT
jgi:geranylgeranyl diphosphate synthase type I